MNWDEVKKELQKDWSLRQKLWYKLTFWAESLWFGLYIFIKRIGKND